MRTLHLTDNKGVVPVQRFKWHAFRTLACLLQAKRASSSKFLKGTPVLWQGKQEGPT
jgi:hypothetical protein